jgi:hypothetical protein
VSRIRPSRDAQAPFNEEDPAEAGPFSPCRTKVTMAFLVYVKDAGSSDPGEIVGSVLFLLIMAAFLAYYLWAVRP